MIASSIQRVGPHAVAVRCRIGRLALLLLLAGLFGTGCTTTDTPAGGGWRSVTATRTMGMAMRDAMRGADAGFAAGKKVTVTSGGFEKDEIGNFMRMLVGEAVYAAGGTVGPGGDLHAQVNIHVSGIKRVSFFFVPLFDTTRLISEFDAELVVRESTGALVTRQPLMGVAKYEETVILTFFTLPGEYFLRVERAWIRIERSETFLDDVYWHAAGLIRGRSSDVGPPPPPEDANGAGSR